MDCDPASEWWVVPGRTGWHLSGPELDPAVDAAWTGSSVALLRTCDPGIVLAKASMGNAA